MAPAPPHPFPRRGARGSWEAIWSGQGHCGQVLALAVPRQALPLPWGGSGVTATAAVTPCHGLTITAYAS